MNRSLCVFVRIRWTDVHPIHQINQQETHWRIFCHSPSAHKLQLSADVQADRQRFRQTASVWRFTPHERVSPQVNRCCGRPSSSGLCTRGKADRFGSPTTRPSSWRRSSRRRSICLLPRERDSPRCSSWARDRRVHQQYWVKNTRDGLNTDKPGGWVKCLLSLLGNFIELNYCLKISFNTKHWTFIH